MGGFFARFIEKYYRGLRVVVVFGLSFIAPPLIQAAEFNDNIDRTAPDFIKASLLIIGPGDELFSAAGHACIRLECPTFKHDYCFSSESERISSRIPTFLCGNLKMGMFAIPTAEFLKEYESSGRGVTQYAMDLPPEVKQRLWAILDAKVAEGANLPYDFDKRGCAQTMLQCLLAAIGNVDLTAVSWPAKYARSRREILSDALSQHPWGRLFCQILIGASGDHDVSNAEKIILPSDLLEFLRQSSLGGRAVISSSGQELLPKTRAPSSGLWHYVTPMVVAVALVLATLVGWRLKWVWMDYLLLALTAGLGVFLLYLGLVSRLPTTGWSWLMIPFNPFPAIFWKWRRYWALPMAGVLIVWVACLLLAPHQLTDPALVVLVFAFHILYIKNSRLLRMKGTEK